MTSERKRRTARRDDRDRVGRRVILVDLENVAGGPAVGPDEFRRVWWILRHQAIGVRPGDQVVVGASRFTASCAVGALRGEPVQWRWRDGRDGADHALLDFVDPVHAAARFDTLVVASGDHAFAPLARMAGATGMSTHQVIGRGRPSRELWQACSRHTVLRLSRSAAA